MGKTTPSVAHCKASHAFQDLNMTNNYANKMWVMGHRNDMIGKCF
jgi:hypothetical protein